MDKTEGNDEEKARSSTRTERNIPLDENISLGTLASPLDRGDSIYNLASQEVVNETNGLYLLHLARQMSELGMELTSLQNPQYTTASRNARNLRTLSDQFVMSPQRRWVYEQAHNVDLDSLNFRTFHQLLTGLFQEGVVTWERVLVLFYFCTDLSIRTIQEKFVNRFVEIYNWTVFYISRRLSFWVEQQGGWGVVLQNSVNYATRLSIIGICCATVLAICIFIRNRM